MAVNSLKLELSFLPAFLYCSSNKIQVFQMALLTF